MNAKLAMDTDRELLGDPLTTGSLLARHHDVCKLDYKSDFARAAAGISANNAGCVADPYFSLREQLRGPRGGTEQARSGATNFGTSPKRFAPNVRNIYPITGSTSGEQFYLPPAHKSLFGDFDIGSLEDRPYYSSCMKTRTMSPPPRIYSGVGTTTPQRTFNPVRRKVSDILFLQRDHMLDNISPVDDAISGNYSVLNKDQKSRTTIRTMPLSREGLASYTAPSELVPQLPRTEGALTTNAKNNDEDPISSPVQGSWDQLLLRERAIHNVYEEPAVGLRSGPGILRTQASTETANNDQTNEKQISLLNAHNEQVADILTTSNAMIKPLPPRKARSPSNDKNDGGTTISIGKAVEQVPDSVGVAAQVFPPSLDSKSTNSTILPDIVPTILPDSSTKNVVGSSSYNVPSSSSQMVGKILESTIETEDEQDDEINAGEDHEEPPVLASILAGPVVNAINKDENVVASDSSTDEKRNRGESDQEEPPVLASILLGPVVNALKDENVVATSDSSSFFEKRSAAASHRSEENSSASGVSLLSKSRAGFLTDTIWEPYNKTFGKNSSTTSSGVSYLKTGTGTGSAYFDVEQRKDFEKNEQKNTNNGVFPRIVEIEQNKDDIINTVKREILSAPPPSILQKHDEVVDVDHVQEFDDQFLLSESPAIDILRQEKREPRPILSQAAFQQALSAAKVKANQLNEQTQQRSSSSSDRISPSQKSRTPLKITPVEEHIPHPEIARNSAGGIISSEIITSEQYNSHHYKKEQTAEINKFASSNIQHIPTISGPMEQAIVADPDPSFCKNSTKTSSRMSSPNRHSHHKVKKKYSSFFNPVGAAEIGELPPEPAAASSSNSNDQQSLDKIDEDRDKIDEDRSSRASDVPLVVSLPRDSAHLPGKEPLISLPRDSANPDPLPEERAVGGGGPTIRTTALLDDLLSSVPDRLSGLESKTDQPRTTSVRTTTLLNEFLDAMPAQKNEEKNSSSEHVESVLNNEIKASSLSVKQSSTENSRASAIRTTEWTAQVQSLDARMDQILTDFKSALPEESLSSFSASSEKKTAEPSTNPIPKNADLSSGLEDDIDFLSGTVKYERIPPLVDHIRISYEQVGDQGGSTTSGGDEMSNIINPQHKKRQKRSNRQGGRSPVIKKSPLFTTDMELMGEDDLSGGGGVDVSR